MGSVGDERGAHTLSEGDCIAPLPTPTPHPLPSITADLQRQRRCCRLVASLMDCSLGPVHTACGILNCNTFALSTFEGTVLGLVLYEAPLSFVNHSCQPNAVRGEDGLVRVTAPVAEGEEVREVITTIITTCV